MAAAAKAAKREELYRILDEYAREMGDKFDRATARVRLSLIIRFAKKYDVDGKKLKRPALFLHRNKPLSREWFDDWLRDYYANNRSEPAA